MLIGALWQALASWRPRSHLASNVPRFSSLSQLMVLIPGSGYSNVMQAEA